jgi:uncharacterized membrane protein (UPF0127 family)
MIDLEYADDNESRIKWLMYRDMLWTMSWMLFIFTGEEIRSFWMKNTYIPLDMIFLDNQMNMVSIYTGAKPEDLTPISSIYPAQYVLEVNSEWTTEHNITTWCQLIYQKK